MLMSFALVIGKTLNCTAIRTWMTLRIPRGKVIIEEDTASKETESIDKKLVTRLKRQLSSASKPSS